jgi:hypothetical protein
MRRRKIIEEMAKTLILCYAILKCSVIPAPPKDGFVQTAKKAGIQFGSPIKAFGDDMRERTITFAWLFSAKKGVLARCVSVFR